MAVNNLNSDSRAGFGCVTHKVAVNNLNSDSRAGKEVETLSQQLLFLLFKCAEEKILFIIKIISSKYIYNQNNFAQI